MDKFTKIKRNIEIKNWLDKYNISRYTINDDLTVDVEGIVNLQYLDLYNIPFQFGTVTRFFRVQGNKLTSNKGFPLVCYGGVFCYYNKEMIFRPEYYKGEFFYNSIDNRNGKSEIIRV